MAPIKKKILPEGKYSAIQFGRVHHIIHFHLSWGKLMTPQNNTHINGDEYAKN